ncbi:MAG TPA: GMC oxidoreductase [Candidatus Limnocylindria bacterium]
MMIDARSLADGESITADLCIVGAGAAGIALAMALADAPFRTVILESGDLALEADTQRLNEGTNSGLDYFPLVGTRLRYFGGTTNHWGGTCRPFDEADLAGTDGVPDTTWPITLDDIAPYYDEAGRIAQLESSDWDVDSWADQSRFGPLPLDPDAIETRVALIVDPARRSFNRVHAAEVEDARAVTTYLNANVIEVRLSDDHATVRDLVVATPGRTFSVAAQRFVLAAGGIENPRILLASNRQQPDGVGNGEGLVGRYFMEHPRFIGGIIEPIGEGVNVSFYEQHTVDGSRVLGYLALAESLRRSEGLVDVQMRLLPILTDPHQRARRSNDVEALRRLVERARGDSDGGSLAEDAGSVLDDLTSWRRLLVPGGGLPVPQPDLVRIVSEASPEQLDALLPEFFGDIAVFGYGEISGSPPLSTIEISTRIDQAPNPDSRVTLGTDRDAFGMPRPNLDWQLSRIDRESVDRAMEVLGQELGRTGTGRLRLRLPEDGWPSDLEGGYHHMGTTRMSADPVRGVVDADCRVHGVSNLYVAGSSTFTTGGSATPTLTLIALALRLADHLRAEFG